MVTISVVYPKTATSRFDHDYYQDRHVPLVKSCWTSMGLKGMDLFRGTATLDGSPPGYELIGLLHFSSVEDIAPALAAHGAEIMGDIPNFTDVRPLIQRNDPVGGTA